MRLGAKPTIGIRAETMHAFERRVAITPSGVRTLVDNHGMRVYVQRSPIRVFPGQAYREAGAEVVTELSPYDIPVFFGVKQIPADILQVGKTYIYFSHVHKGQKENMHMLRTLMERSATLIDYERIVDEHGDRLVAFGYFAGVAGMTDTLHVLGKRLEHLGFKDNPLSAIRQTLWYQGGMQEILAHLREIGELIKRHGLPKEMGPMVVGFTGSRGRVATGASDIFDALQPVDITPQQLLEIGLDGLSRFSVYRVMFSRKDRVAPRNPDVTYSNDHFAKYPEQYRSTIPQYLPFLTAFVHCAYWEDPQPRLITTDDLLALGTNPRLKVIGDISCDIQGGVQATVRGTTPSEPFFTFNPSTGEAPSGWLGQGIVVNALETAPSELPLDASNHFAHVLFPFVPAIATADYRAPFAEGILSLPEPIREAVIVWRGQLTPAYDAMPKIHAGLQEYGHVFFDVNH